MPDLLTGSDQFNPEFYPVPDLRTTAERLLDVAILQADYVRQIQSNIGRGQ